MEEGGNGVDAAYRVVPSYAVVEAVADAEGVPPEDLCPPEYEALHEVVDPQALDMLFERRNDGRSRPGGTVRFIYCGYDVTVEGDGTVELDPG